jgi:hypothetical protein
MRKLHQSPEASRLANVVVIFGFRKYVWYVSEAQRPRSFTSQSRKFLLPADVAAPARYEWPLYNFGSNPDMLSNNLVIFTM